MRFSKDARRWPLSLPPAAIRASARWRSHRVGLEKIQSAFMLRSGVLRSGACGRAAAPLMARPHLRASYLRTTGWSGLTA